MAPGPDSTTQQPTPDSTPLPTKPANRPRQLNPLTHPPDQLGIPTPNLYQPNTHARLHHPRPTCYRCFKPAILCLCAAIPRVTNTTHICILQHPRERLHPLGTARIALQGLTRVSRIVGKRAHDDRCILPRPELPTRTGVLYPSPHAKPLTQLTPFERPDALVVIDGTWSQAKSVYDDNAWLEQLPHYRLDPDVKSRYRIRRQPADFCLSTIESIADALTQLEPETTGVGELVAALDEMIDRQTTHRPEDRAVPRFKRARRRGPRHVPEVLCREPERIVAVYGEAAQREGDRRGDVPSLLQWTAARPFAPDAPAFEFFVEPEAPPRAGYLDCLGMATWPGGGSLDAFARAWSAWLRDDDVLAPWNDTAARLLDHALARVDADFEATPRIRLKESYCNVRGGPCGGLLDVAAREGVAISPNGIAGRAGERLGATAAMARWLREAVASGSPAAPDTSAAGRT